MFAALLIFSAASAQAREPVTPGELAALAGVDKTLDEVVSALSEQGDAIAQESGALGDRESFTASWHKAAALSFAPSKLKAAFAIRMNGKLTPEETGTVAAFYQSPLGQRIVGSETTAATPAGQQQMMSEAEDIMELLLKSPLRQAALDRIIRSARLDEMSINMAVNVSRAMLIGLTTTGTGATRMTLEDIVIALDEQRPQIAAETAVMTKLSLAFAYRDLPMEDLVAYAEFLETQAGSKHADAVMKGLDAVLSEAALSFGNALSGDLERTPI